MSQEKRKKSLFSFLFLYFTSFLLCKTEFHYFFVEQKFYWETSLWSFELTILTYCEGMVPPVALTQKCLEIVRGFPDNN